MVSPSHCCRAVCYLGRKAEGTAHAEMLSAGGTASGKTRVCGLLGQHLDEGGCTLLQQQSFYRSLTAEELADVACAQPHAPCEALLAAAAA